MTLDCVGQVVGIGMADVLGNDHVPALRARDRGSGDIARFQTEQAGKEQVDRVAPRGGQVDGDLDGLALLVALPVSTVKVWFVAFQVPSTTSESCKVTGCPFAVFNGA